MNAEAERALRNLTIVALLKQHDKLLTLADTFVVHPPSYVRGVYRLWCGESRDNNIMRLTETVDAAFRFIWSVHTPMQGDVRHRELAASRMQQALGEAATGLSNLIDTYTEDSTMQVRLRLLVQHIEDTLAVIGTHPQTASALCGGRA